MSASKRPLTWLITGCSSGLGLSLARSVKAAGHIVIASSRDPSRTPDLVAEFDSQQGADGGGRWVKLDVTSPTSAEVIDDLERSGVEIDVLANNAGFCDFCPLETAAEEDLRAQMEAMYFGPLRLIRTVVPHMRGRKSGVIVNMSSGAAIDGNPTMGGYAGAKGGLDAATKILAKEIASFNIRTLTVVLGTFNTNFGNAASFSKNPLPDAYKGSFAEKMITAISSGKAPANGDRNKAAQSIVDVVTGTGPGAGLEKESFLPLGSDMVARVGALEKSLQHSLDVFGQIAISVKLEA